MKSLHAFMKEEFGQRSIFLLQQWENLERRWPIIETIKGLP